VGLRKLTVGRAGALPRVRSRLLTLLFLRAS